MYKTSDAYKKAIAQPNRRFRLSGRIYLRDGGTIEITDDNVSADGELKIETQMMSGSASEKSFDVGAVPAAKLTMTLLDDGDIHNFSKARIELNVSLRLEDGSYETVPMGIFYIDGGSLKRVGGRIGITAYDAMLKLHYIITDEMRAALNGKTAAEAAKYLADIAAVPFEQDLGEFLNSDILLDFSSEQVKKGRDGIMWIAQLMGCFARINRLGYLEFVQLSPPWNPDSMATVRVHDAEIEADRRIRTEAADDRVRVRSVTTRDNSGKLLTMRSNLDEAWTWFQYIDLEIEQNPLLISMSRNELGSILKNIMYILMTISYTPGSTETANDPSIDAGDLIQIVQGGDAARTVDFYVTHNIWRYCDKHEIINAGVVPVVYDGDEASAVSMMSDGDGISVQTEDGSLIYAAPESQSSLAANAAPAPSAPDRLVYNGIEAQFKASATSSGNEVGLDVLDPKTGPLCMQVRVSNTPNKYLYAYLQNLNANLTSGDWRISTKSDKGRDLIYIGINQSGQISVVCDSMDLGYGQRRLDIDLSNLSISMVNPQKNISAKLEFKSDGLYYNDHRLIAEN